MGSVQRNFGRCALYGAFFRVMSGDAQAGAGDRFAVLVVQVGRYGLDGFAVQSGATALMALLSSRVLEKSDRRTLWQPTSR